MSCNRWKDSFDLTQFFIIMKNFIINEEMVGKIGKLYAKGGFFFREYYLVRKFGIKLFQEANSEIYYSLSEYSNKLPPDWPKSKENFNFVQTQR